MTLADALEAVLAERGPLPAATLARELRRRYAVVLAALHADARFEHEGRRKASRWSLSPSRNGRHPASRSTADLGRLLNRGQDWVERLMAESEAMGIVERAGDGWRLSAAGERRFGTALRALTLGQDGA